MECIHTPPLLSAVSFCIFLRIRLQGGRHILLWHKAVPVMDHFPNKGIHLLISCMFRLIFNAVFQISRIRRSYAWAMFRWHADILFPGTERFKLFFRGLQTVLKSGNIFKRIIHRQVLFFGFMVLKSDSSGISVLPCAVPVSGSHIFGTKNIFQISALFTMEYGST